MIDPISLLSLIGLCGSICCRVAQIVTSLDALKESYKNTRLAIEGLNAQINAVEAAASRLASWLRQSSQSLSETEYIGLEKSISACANLISALEGYVADLGVEAGDPDNVSQGSKTRYVRHETSIKEFRDLLQCQVQALSFFLQALQLPIKSERESRLESDEGQQILKRAVDSASSLFVLKDSASIQSFQTTSTLRSRTSKYSVSFSFDWLLMGSRAYRRAFGALMKGSHAGLESIPRLRCSANRPSDLQFSQANNRSPTPNAHFTAVRTLETSGNGPQTEELATTEPPRAQNMSGGTGTSAMTAVFDADLVQLSQEQQMRLALLDRQISQAISSSAYQTLKRLIMDPSNPKFPPKWFSWSLRQALEREAIDSLRLMVMHGFDIEAVDGFMRSPLFYVCSKGLVATTKFLLNHGASPEAANFSGERPLHAACLVGNTDIVHRLITHGADVNSTNCKGETPLHYACLWGETTVALALIARGADIWVKSQNGETPLHYAISRAQTPIVSLLISTCSTLPSTEDPGKAYREYVLQELAKEEKYVVSLNQKPPLLLTGKFASACARIRRLVQCAEMILELQVEGYGRSFGYSQLRQSILFSMALSHAGLASRETTISGNMKLTAKAVWHIPPQELSNKIDGMSDEDLHACLMRFRRGDALVSNSLKSIGSTKWSRATRAPRKNVNLSDGVKVETTVHTYVEVLPTSDINSAQGDTIDSFLTDGFSSHNINTTKPDDLAAAEDYQRLRSDFSTIDQTVLDGRLYSAVALNRLTSVKQLLLCGASPNFLLEDRSLLNQMPEQDRVKMTNLLKQFSFGS